MYVQCVCLNGYFVIQSFVCEDNDLFLYSLFKHIKVVSKNKTVAYGKAICEMGGLYFVRNTLQVESTEGPNFPIQPPFNPHSAISVFNTEGHRLV